jgi:hypothetical protein
MNTVYQIFFTIVLEDPGSTKQITSVEELLESEIKYCYFPHLDPTLNTSNDLRLRNVVSGRSNCTRMLLCFGRIDIYADFAYFEIDEQDKCT